jgi:pyruvate formate lyase activating enzyme
MIVNGLQKLSLLDYPTKTAATIFFAGCNFRCPFCHNGDLVLNSEKADKIDDEEIMEFLKTRVGLLDGICITGGEPLLKNDLMPFISKVKEMGFLVKLDTNGSFPMRLKELLGSGMIDYVAMDVKNSKDKYGLTSGIPKIMQTDIINKIEASIKLLTDSSVDYEFRTTVTKELHDLNDMEEIGKWIQGSKKYVIQNFMDSEKTIAKGFSSQDEEWILEAKKIVQKYVDEVLTR